MNILMVSNEFAPSIGGVQTHVLELSRAMVRQGHHVYVLTRHRDKSALKNERLDGIHVKRVSLAKNHLLYDWQLTRYMKKLIADHHIDVVHVHGMRPLSACRSLKELTVFTNHTSSFLKRAKQGDRANAKMAQQLSVSPIVLAPSEELAERTRETGYNGQVQFVSNGVDIAKFYPGKSTLRQQLKIPETAFVAVLARRLVEKNGVLYLAKALAQINDPNFHLIVAGDGADRDQFESIIQMTPCADRVHMLGYVANEDMADIYRSGDVSILPSLMEATSIAGLEAMACGLAMIGTRVGGIPVIIADGESGLLVDSMSSDGLAGAMNTLLADREKARTMGGESFKRAKDNFSWDKISDQTVKLYKEHLKTRD